MRKDFPLLNNRKIVYLDNAATTQKPKIVIDTLKFYYENVNANAHRGIYSLSEETTKMLEDSRKIFSKFINSNPENVIFTKNATEGLNLIATTIERTLLLTKEDNIVVTEIEHHSNFLPWQQLCGRNNLLLKVVPYNNRKNNIEDISKYVDKNTKVVAFSAMSNVTGLVIDIVTQIKKIRNKNKDALIIIDATQYIAHNRVDVKKIDADFVVFSAHKIYGTTGVGIVYSKTKFLEKLEPFLYGGNMISYVSIEESKWADFPEKFEAGTLDYASIIASAKAILYLEKNFKEFIGIEKKLTDYALKRLKSIKGLRVIGHDKNNYGPVISFTVKGIHPHDLATICDRYNVCVRSGHHCAQPLMKKLGVLATTRVSISFYNNTEDIDKLIMAINNAKKILRV